MTLIPLYTKSHNNGNSKGHRILVGQPSRVTGSLLLPGDIFGSPLATLRLPDTEVRRFRESGGLSAAGAR